MSHKKRLLFSSAIIIRCWLVMLLFAFTSSLMAQTDDSVPPQGADGSYAISTAAQLEAFAKIVNDGTPEVNARLEADIDLGELSSQYFTPIGKDDANAFKGTFDGGGHTISNLKISPTNRYGGLFGVISGSAVVKDIYIDKVTATITASSQVIVGGVCGKMMSNGNGAPKIQRCQVANADIDGYNYMGGKKESNLGGICGYMVAKQSPGNIISECTFKGSIAGNYMCGGIVGFLDGYLNTISQCSVYTGSSIKGKTGFGGIVGQVYGMTKMSIKQCTVETGCEICGIDNNSASKYGTICGYEEQPKELPTIDGYLCIYTAEHLKAFASYVNDMHQPRLKAQLMCDIDLSELTDKYWRPIGDGTVYETALGQIGGGYNQFSGTFDGNGHTIRHLKIRPAKGSGLFGYIKGANIKNLTIDSVSIDKCSKGVEYIGSLAGMAVSSNISDCTVSNAVIDGQTNKNHNFWGGIVGTIVYGTMSNCNTLASQITASASVGGIVGVVGGESEPSKLTGCSISGTSVSGDDKVGGIAGSMYVNAGDSPIIVNCTASADCVINGTTHFGQIFGYEQFPNEPVLVDGYYEIFTATQLQKFTEKVNASPYNKINGRLMRDIDLAELGKNAWTPIGTPEASSLAGGFMGIFDGNGHTVRNLILSAKIYSGFFGLVHGTVKNLTLDGVTSNASNSTFMGALCGMAIRGGAVISNCHVRNAAITSKNTTSSAGGLVGTASGVDTGTNGVTITECTFQGSIGNSSRSGGIVGYIIGYAIDVRNCTVLSGSSISGGYSGGICGYTNTHPNVCISNCVVASDCSVASGTRIYGKYEPSGGTPHLINGVYQIACLQDLKWFRDYANDNDRSANARLVADIDMLNEEFSPIGDYGHNSSKIYRGTFDGNGHTLSNFRLKKWSEYSGLVGYANGATIKNVNIKNVTTPFSPNYDYEGAILGFGTNHTWVLNCHVTDADVFYNVDCQGDYHGGIAGKVDVGSHIEGCTFQGKVGGDDYVGGIVGEVNSGSTIRDCIVKTGSVVYARNYMGGVAGAVYDTETKVVDCFSQPGVTLKEYKSAKYKSDLAGYIECSPTNNSDDERGLYYHKTGGTTTSDNGSTTCYDTEVVGNVSGYDSHNYEVCTDMGITYSYFNKRICASTFENTSNLHTFSFIDYNHNTGAQRAYRWIDMSIADKAFHNCYNFKELNMRYRMGGKDGFHVMLDPTDVYPEGAHAFDGCDALKIYVDADKYDAFVNDSRWGKYRDRIVSTTSMRKAEHTEKGIRYARDNQKNSKGEYQTVTGTGGKTVYCVHVIGSDNLTDQDGVAKIYNDIGITYAYRTTKIWAESFRGKSELRTVRFLGAMSGTVYTPMQMTIGSRAFADCPNLQTIDVVYGNTNSEKYEALKPTDVYPVDDTMLKGNPYTQIRVWPSLVDEFKTDPHWAPYADRIVAWTQGGREYREDGVIYQSYSTDDSGSKLDDTWLVNTASGHNDKLQTYLNRNKSDFVSFDAQKFIYTGSSNVYYLRVAGVDNEYLTSHNGKVCLYNDIGSYYNYRTVNIDATAFRGNNNLRYINFGDVNHNTATTDVPMQIAIQKGAFLGCWNLEYIDLVYYKYTGVNRVLYLDPTQVVPAKGIFDENAKTKIRVNPEKVAEFKADPNWAQYADRIIAFEASDGTLHYEDGVTYMESGMAYDSPDGVRCFETYVTGVSDNDRRDFTLYNDIGETYAYRNVLIKSYAFTQNNKLNSISFSDAVGGSAHNWISMRIADNAFDQCYQFKAMYMSYLATAGIEKDHTIMLDPEDVRPEGKYPFTDCPQLKIYVDAEKYDAFVKDSLWGRYADQIVATTDMRHCDFAEEGSLYARDHNKDGTASYKTENGEGGKTVSLVHVNGPDDNLLSKYDGVAVIFNDPGSAWAYRTTKVWAEAYTGCTDLRMVRFKGAHKGHTYTPFNLTIGHRAFADCPNLQYIDVVYGNTNTEKYEAITPTQVYPVDSTMMQGNSHALIRVWPDLVDEFKADPHWAPYADRIIAWSSSGKIYSDEDGLVYTSYTNGSNDLSCTELCSTVSGHDEKLKAYLEEHKSEFADSKSINFDEFLCGSSYGNVYYTRATALENSYLKKNRGRVTLYNDIGSYYNYRTVAIDCNAFRGNQNLRRLDFGDISYAGKTDVPLKLMIEKGAFKGCTNFEKLDLIYRKYTGTNTIVYLDPTQVIPAKDLFDKDSKVQIRVGADKIEAFKADPNWKQYADRIIAYEASFDEYEVEGITYTVTVDKSNNRKVIYGDNGEDMYETKVTDCENTSDLTDYVIYTDIGTSRDYFNTTIQNGAFSGEKSLRSLRFADTSEAGAVQAYKWIDMKIEDKAFLNCPNFKSLHMRYTMYAGWDHVVMLGPNDVYPIGQEAFYGCDSLKIYVDPEKYNEFINNEHWRPYADRIVSTTSMRWAEHTYEGVAYTRVNNKDGRGSYGIEHPSNSSKDVYQLEVMGPDREKLIKNHGVAKIYNDIGLDNAYRTKRILAQAFDGCKDLTSVRLHGARRGHVYTPMGITIGSRAFANCPGLHSVDLVYGDTNDDEYKPLEPTDVIPDDETILDGSPYAKIRVWPTLVQKFKNDSRWGAYADRIVAWEPVGREYTGENGLVYQGFLSASRKNKLDLDDLCSSTDGHNETLKNYLKTSADDYVSVDYDKFSEGTGGSNVYYIHVSATEANWMREHGGKVTIYNDIGSYYNYRTVYIDSTAFRGNDIVTSIDFGDNPTDLGKTDLPLRIMIAKNAFKGCTRLRSINMVYHKYTGSNTITYLDPDQVIPPKEMFDNTGNRKVAICVSPDKVNAYKADPNWKQYADQIVAYTESYDDFTEDGVVYGYMPVLRGGLSDDYYSNRYNEEFRNDYAALHGNNYGEFEWSDILTTDDYYDKSARVWYMQIKGVDNSTIRDNNGHLTLYNDIGTSYSYKTIAIAPYAFAGNENIVSVSFSDQCSAFATCHDSEWGMILPDGVFKDCKNLKHIDMVEYVTLGVPNHYAALSPKQIIIGDHAFDGCPDDFEIRVPAEMYEEFVNDPNWSRYRKHIAIFEFTPTETDGFNVDGVEYDYASHLLNNMPTEQRAYMSWSLINIPIQIAKAVVMAALSASTGGAAGAFFAGTSIAAGFTSGFVTYFVPSIVSNIVSQTASIILAEMGASYAATIALSAAMGLAWGAYDGLLGMYELGLRQAITQGLKSIAISYGISGATTGATRIYNDISGASDAILATTGNDPSADLMGTIGGVSTGFADLFSGTYKTTAIESIYHMYIKGVDNSKIKDNGGVMNIYNDPGSYYHYRTVGMDSKALRGNKNIRHIKFTDCNGVGTNVQSTFQMSVPDSTFMDCSNLERLDMFMLCTEGSNNTQALGPENFCLCGNNVFKNCDKLKVYVAPNKYDVFKNDSIWGKLNLVIDYEYEEPTTENYWGVYYGNNYKLNSKWDYMTQNSRKFYNVHVVKPDNEYLKSNNGQATIVTDYGVTYNYNTTYVGRRAFYGNKLIKSVNFKDTYSKNATCYMLPAYELRDSAFAMCPNMESIYMIYSKDGNRLMPLTPSQVSLGSGVFSGSPKLKIKVLYDNWADYLINSSWMKYGDQISPVLTYFSDDAVANIFADDEVTVKGYGDNYGNKIYEARLDDIKDGVAYNNKFDRLKGNTNIKSFDELKTWGTLGLSRVFDNMFYGCSKLCSVVLPYSIRSIGDDAFAGCSSLQSISIPDSVTSIGSGAFSASGIKAFYFRSEVPAQLGTNPFLGCPVSYIIYVPANSVAKYKEQWAEYADHIMSVGTRKTYYKVDMGNIEGTLAAKLGLRLNSDHTDSHYADINTLMGDVSRIDSLEIIGNINGYDLVTIGCLANRGLQYLDLSKANFRGKDKFFFKWLGEYAGLGNNFSIGKIFSRLRTINTIVLPEADVAYSLWENGSDILGPIFKESHNLSTVVVHRSPTCTSSAFVNSGLKNIVSLSDDYIDFEDALDGFIGSVDLYCPNTANSKYTANSSHKNLFGHVYSPFKDDEVFRILAKKGYFNFQKLGGLSNTKDWFTGTDIKSFDELYVAMSDSILANRCFADCRKLETIALPMTLAYIDNTAFEGCSSLRTVKILGDKPAKLESENVFDDLPEDYRIKVLPSCIDDYRRAWPEKIVRHIMAFDEDAEIQTITMDKPGTLAQKLGLELSSSQMVVLSGNFDSYKKLKVVGPINPVDINTLAILGGQSRKMEGEYKDYQNWYNAKKNGWDADEFFNIGTDIISDYSPASSNLKFLDLSEASFVNLDGVARPDFVLPRRMFQNCDVLETIVLPRTMKKLTVDALSYSDHLKRVVLGDSTTVIERHALTNCPRLKSVTSMRGDLNLSGGDRYHFNTTESSPFHDDYTLDTLYCAKEDHLALASNSYVQKYCKNVVEAYRDKSLMKLMVTKDAITEEEMYKVRSFDDMFRGNSEISDLRALSNCIRVKNVDDKAFANMSHLKRMALPSSIETLGQQLFVGSDSLQYVDWHAGQSGILVNNNRSDEASPLYKLPRRTLVYAPVAVNDDDENIVSTQGTGDWYAPRFWRDDQQAVEIPFAFSTNHAEIERTFKKGVKSTVYLPFAIDESAAAALGQFYEFTGYNSGTGEVSFRRVRKTEACKGYLFLPANAKVEADATDAFITVCRTDSGIVNTAKDGMYGTWERKTWTTTRGDDYGYAAAAQGNVSEGSFVRIEAGSWLSPMRSWLRLNPNSGAKPQRLAMLIDDDDEPTGVIGIDNDGNPTSQPSIVNVYTVDGKMVRHDVDATNCLKGLPKGVYVVNGKKVYCQ